MKNLDEILCMSEGHVHTPRSILATQHINNRIEYDHLLWVFNTIKDSYWDQGEMPDQDNDPVYHLDDMLMVTDRDSLPIES